MNLLIGYLVMVQNVQKSLEASHLKGLHSFFNSAVKVNDSQACRNMKMTREGTSFIFNARDMLLSVQIDFSFVRAAVAYQTFERTSGFELLSETTAPRYLKLVMVPSFFAFTLISLWMPLVLFVISLVF